MMMHGICEHLHVHDCMYVCMLLHVVNMSTICSLRTLGICVCFLCVYVRQQRAEHAGEEGLLMFSKLF